jgi:lysine 2,3-aminomutase
VSSFALRPSRWRKCTEGEWSDWRWQLRNALKDASTIAECLGLSASRRALLLELPFRHVLSPHVVALMSVDGVDGPLGRQFVAQPGELELDAAASADPLNERAHMVTELLLRRYRDRALLYVTGQCAAHCRHCTRRRKVGRSCAAPRAQQLQAALAYLREHTELRELLISGGDPLSLSNGRLRRLLSALREIEHLEVLRLCTRMPSVLPQRIDAELCELLDEYGPIWLMTHFNHVSEASVESEQALTRLRRSGVLLMNQTVLLQGVNATPEAIEALNRWMLRWGCRPYYLFQTDLVQGMGALRTPVRAGLEIMESLSAGVSGLCVPHLAVDLPGGGGKVRFAPTRLRGVRGRALLFEGVEGEQIAYEDVSASSARWCARVMGVSQGVSGGAGND